MKLTRRKLSTRKPTKRKLSKRKLTRRKVRKQRGGADLPIPEGAVASVRMDPKDPYSVPLLVTKDVYEEEVLEK